MVLRFEGTTSQQCVCGCVRARARVCVRVRVRAAVYLTKNKLRHFLYIQLL